MTDRLTRDAYGLKMAEAAASRADCTRRQVGAVIVSADGSIVATGYNGRASGLPGCLTEGACPRGQMTYAEQPAGVGYAETACDAAHAEVNAVIRAGRDRCLGATIYVTDAPCHGCQVVIAAAGLARVVSPPGMRRRFADLLRVRRKRLRLPLEAHSCPPPTPPLGAPRTSSASAASRSGTHATTTVAGALPAELSAARSRPRRGERTP